MKNNKRYFISFTVILSIVMFSFISSVAVFASENIFTDGTELDISENKKTNLYNVDNTANENDFISEIEESEMSKTVLNEENIDPKELHEYSCAMKSHFRKFGNQMSGSGNHLCNYASLLA